MNILTLNKSVFSGKTKTTKRKRLTEKSIKSELVIPDSAVELGYEEMDSFKITFKRKVYSVTIEVYKKSNTSGWNRGRVVLDNLIIYE